MANPLPPPVSRHGLWRNYGLAEGLDLLDLQLEYVAAGGDGCLWFGTAANGALCLDGELFSRLGAGDGLTGRNVMAILLDRRGKLWLGGWDGGVFCRERGGARLTVVETVPRGVSALFEDRDGRIWAAGRHWIGWSDGNRFQSLTTDAGQGCWGIAQDRQGALWFAYHSPGRLLRWDGAAVEEISLEHAFGGSALPGVSVATDRAGAVWVGGRDRVYRWPDNGSALALEEPSACIRRVQCDRQGRLWLCTTDGAFWYDGHGLQRLGPEDGLAHACVNCMHEDEAGTLWFATFGGGVSRYDPEHIQAFDSRRGLPHDAVSVLATAAPTGLWVGFSGIVPDTPLHDGAGILQDGRFTRPEAAAPIRAALALCRDRHDRVWLGTVDGLYRAEGTRLTALGADQGFTGWMVSALCHDHDGSLLLGHWQGRDQLGLSRYDGRFRLQYALAQDDDQRWYISAILVRSNGEVWFAVGDYCHRKGRGVGRLRPDGQVEWYGTADGLVDDRVRDLLEDQRGDLWIATWGGLSRFDGQRFTSFTTGSGLPSDQVLCLHTDRQGQLWLGTSRGPVRYSGAHFQALSCPDIGPTRAIRQDGEGRYWFATLRGLFRYTPDATPPRVQILRMVADRTYSLRQHPEVPASCRRVTFEFTGTGRHSNAREMLYACHLEGFQDDWQPPSAALQAHYDDLPPGDYVFRVCAVDRELDRSTPAAMPFRVAPDLWRQSVVEALNQSGPTDRFLCLSPAMRQLESLLAQAAPSDLAVLIIGETGTGKGVAARALHRLSGRAAGPFVQVTCGAIPAGLVESELFGHERGAFTGATARRAGRVELAQGGTLFLDEIGDLPLEAQAKLLRVLEEKTFERVGGSATLRADVRIVAATNRDLKRMVAANQFREDLYYRLRVFEVELPPLRQRAQDIPILADYFRERTARHLSKQVTGISTGSLAALRRYPWPGNVRELEHVIQRAVVVCRTAEVEPADLSLQLGATGATPGRVLTLEEVERKHIADVLAQTGGQIKGPKGAAGLLGMAPSTLTDRMRRLGLHGPPGPPPNPRAR